MFASKEYISDLFLAGATMSYEEHLKALWEEKIQEISILANNTVASVGSHEQKAKATKLLLRKRDADHRKEKAQLKRKIAEVQRKHKEDLAKVNREHKKDLAGVKREHENDLAEVKREHETRETELKQKAKKLKARVQCQICMEVKLENMYCLVPCGHMLCGGCMADYYIYDDNSCPHCRQVVKEKVKLFYG